MKLLPILFCFAVAGCQEGGRIVEGTFTVNGKPKPGVEVRLPNNLGDFSDCGGAPLAAVTDQYGKFTARATEYPIRPCFTVDGKIYSDFFIVNDHKEDPIELRCSLETSGHFEDGHVC